jgi:putative restriction endonuclease
MKTVLTARVGSGYEDILEERYHFPATYLNQIRAGVGDQFVYYEPRRDSATSSSAGGRQSYFAIGRLGAIEPDTIRPDHYFVSIHDFLSFIHDVPFRAGTTFFESALQRPDGNTNRGAFGRAVRNLPDNEFEQIVQLGFAGEIPSIGASERPSADLELAEEPADFIRPIIEITSSRLFRDRVFARTVQAAYDGTCAITGIKMINGGGRAEAQAAHIKPVAHSGPDSVGNGIALSGTIHWMFDRGLISVDNDYRILTAPRAIPDAVRRLLKPDGYLIVPKDGALKPHPHYLRYHRETIFKG